MIVFSVSFLSYILYLLFGVRCLFLWFDFFCFNKEKNEGIILKVKYIVVYFIVCFFILKFGNYRYNICLCLCKLLFVIEIMLLYLKIVYV